MAQLDFPAFETHLKAFDFQRLFLEVLGWNRPATGRDWQATRSRWRRSMPGAMSSAA